MPSFPLPRGFFRCSALSPDELDQFAHLSSEVTVGCILNSRVANPALHWRLVDDVHEVQIYQGMDPAAPPRAAIWLGVTHIAATLDEIPSVNVAPDDATYKSAKKLTEKDMLLDCAHLYNIPTDSADTTVNLRWASIKFPMAGMIKPRDFCLLEAQVRFTLDGFKGYAIATTSIELSCCPDFQEDLGLVRGRFYRTGTIYLESNRRGVLQVTRLVETDLGGSMPSWVIDLGQRNRMKSMRDLDRLFQERRLSATTFRTPVELVPKATRSKCYLCHRNFKLFGKTQCRKCGEVMCRSCSMSWIVHVSSFDVKVTICTSCSLAPRHDTLDGSVVYAPSTPSYCRQGETAASVSKFYRSRSQKSSPPMAYLDNSYKLEASTTCLYYY
ncbi:hypothetical protein AeMF1_003666 [Aphanomyces euteiches]|nr:hypothetical protein AeMF1_003666 [Aphanomyces euteiches]